MEVYSNCCTALPLQPLYDNLGTCSHCKDGAVFFPIEELTEDDDMYDEKKDYDEKLHKAMDENDQNEVLVKKTIKEIKKFNEQNAQVMSQIRELIDYINSFEDLIKEDIPEKER